MATRYACTTMYISFSVLWVLQVLQCHTLVRINRCCRIVLMTIYYTLVIMYLQIFTSPFFFILCSIFSKSCKCDIYIKYNMCLQSTRKHLISVRCFLVLVPIITCDNHDIIGVDEWFSGCQLGKLQLFWLFCVNERYSC